jgi:hypothetical protein
VDLIGPVLGTLGENEFWKLVLLQTRGRVEPHRPTPDDQRVDFLVQPMGRFEPIYAIQVKVRTVLTVRRRARLLHISLRERASRLITSPYFLYFFAHFDLRTGDLSKWFWLVPSGIVHRLAKRIDGDVAIDLFPSFEDNTRDRWLQFRRPIGHLGERVEELLASPPKQSREQRGQWLELVSTLRQYSSAG